VKPFEALGEMSQREACLQVFRALSVGVWISEQDLHARVEELTGTECEKASVKGAAYAAREVMAAGHEPTVDWYMKGYKRLDTSEQVSAVRKRLRRAKRSVGRVVNWSGAALANPELPAPERHAMHQLHMMKLRSDDLEQQRASKQRPRAVEASPD
jgi:hypothetical protein